MNRKNIKIISRDIYVNLSCSFLERTRCKFCGELPYFYYCLRSKTYSKEAFIPFNKMRWLTKRNYKINNDDYIINEPRDFTNIAILSYSVPYMSYFVSPHRIKNIKSNYDYIEYVACPCGKSRWAFCFDFCNHKLEVINRKCRNKHYKKFDW
jgi:hypothetical protein